VTVCWFKAAIASARLLDRQS